MDYAKPKIWINVEKSGEVANLIANQEVNLTDIFAYFERHNDISGKIELDDSGNIVAENNIRYASKENQIKQLFSSLDAPDLLVTEKGLMLTWIGGEENASVLYRIFFVIQEELQDEKYNNHRNPGLKIASHWCMTAMPLAG